MKVDKSDVDRIVANEREWREHIMEQLSDLHDKFNKMDKELATFKIKVFAFAIMFGGVSGFSVEFITGLFKGG